MNRTANWFQKHGGGSMCGIAGFVPGLAEPRPVLTAMLAALAHRGPDAASCFADATIGLAHRRLAVVDLDGGAQPRIDPATGDALIFNGEIYGFTALADALREAGVPLRDRSDTEVLFALLRRHGVHGTLARVNGMFAFAWRDGATGALYLARDRFGEKPLYYGVCGQTLVFGSESSALRCHPAFSTAAPDPISAYALLQFEYLPGDLSGWQGIRKLPPATVLTFKAGKLTLDRYWSPPLPDAAAPIDENEAAERIDALLRDAVRQQSVADVKLGVFLSGGIDSSLLTVLASEVSPGLTALTVRAGGATFDETPHADLVARHAGVRHEIVSLGDADLNAALDSISEHLGEPLADSSLLPTWMVCHAARQRMTVALGGDGADELFAGYPNFFVQRHAGLMARLPRQAGSALRGALALLPASQGYMSLRFRLAQLSHGFGHDTGRQSYLWMAPFPAPLLAKLFDPAMNAAALAQAGFAPIDDAAVQAGQTGDTQALLHQFLLTYLPDDILMKTDRAAMFNSLEVRSPFLHRPLAVYAAGLPWPLKLRGKNGKAVLKRVARRYLPDSIINRRKHGFAVPIGELIRGVLRDRVGDTLRSRSNPAAAWFDRDFIDNLLAQHVSGRHDHGKKLWALFILYTVARQPSPAITGAEPASGLLRVA
jgi:asparagine synthase (glutamine-hydrolysing)